MEKSLFKRQKQFLSQVMNNKGLLVGIKGPTSLSGRKAVSIYQEAYFARLQEVLSEKYGSIRCVLGYDKFYSISKKYIRQNKSTDYNLENYGKKFSGFLKKELKIKKDYPFLISLAELEYLMDQVFHAPTERLKKYRENTLPKFKKTSRFKLVSYLKLPVFKYNIYDIWKAAHDDEQIRVLPKTQYLLISKSKNAVFVREIDKFTSYFLKSCLKGQNIFEIMNNCKNVSFDDLIISLENVFDSYILVKIIE